MTLTELAAVLPLIEYEYDAHDLVVEAVKMLSESGNRIYFIGNGGSAAIASHMAADWQNRTNIAAQAFNDAPWVTCISNDYHYEEVFVRALAAHARVGDMLVAISSSGRSENIIRAASAFEGPVVTLSGFAPTNRLRGIGIVNFYVPSEDYGIVETAHLGILHALLDKVVDSDN